MKFLIFNFNGSWLASAVILFGLAGCAQAAPATQCWAQRYGGAGNSYDVSRALAVGADGEVYVTGFTLIGQTNWNWTTLAYSRAGVAVWTNLYNGPGLKAAEAITVDSANGNIYVTGQDGRQNKSDFSTIAYSSGGVPLWTNSHYDPSIAGGLMRVIAATTNGNLYAGGFLGGMLVRYAAIAYSNSGVALWTNISFRGQIEAMGLDRQGRPIFTGYALATNGAAGLGSVAYSQSGSPLWTNFYFAPTSLANDGAGANALAVDNLRDTVYVSGVTTERGNNAQFLTIAYSAVGTPLWTNYYSALGDSYDEAVAVAVDTNSGNVYVLGVADPGSNGIDCATIAYSKSGIPLWTNRFNPSGYDDIDPGGIAVDLQGNVIVAGVVNFDIMSIAYSSAGTLLWTNMQAGLGDALELPQISPSCLGIGTDGAVYLTVSSLPSDGGTTNWDFVTRKYVSLPDIRFASISRLPDSSSLLWIEAPTNTPYRLEASTNLAGWTPLTNFPALPTTSIQFTDTLAPNFPSRFYRTVWSP